MFMHMLGYPTHFGQMECLKLISSGSYVEKVGVTVLGESTDSCMQSPMIVKGPGRPYVPGGPASCHELVEQRPLRVSVWFRLRE